MVEKRKLEEWKKQYEQIEVPKELDKMLTDIITKEEQVMVLKDKKERKREIMKKVMKGFTGAAVAVCMIVTVGVNVSPVFAQSIAEIPGMEGLVKVLTLKQYDVEKDKSEAHISIPEIKGLENKELQKTLNEELAKEGEASYEHFLEEIKDYEGVEGETARLAMNVDYEVLADNEDVFALRVNQTEIVASANVETKFYVVDKKADKIITLPELFTSDGYIKVISENIISQMKKQMEEDESLVYWIDDEMGGNFTSIAKDQAFYINKDGKLVISFNKYEVGPGCIGQREFVIPTEVIKDLLANKTIIR